MKLRVTKAAEKGNYRSSTLGLGFRSMVMV